MSFGYTKLVLKALSVGAGSRCQRDRKPPGARAMRQNSRGIETSMGQPHIPVMLEESLELLNVRDGLVWVDATAGAGGHLQEIAQRAGESSTVIGIDRDIHALEALKNVCGPWAHLVHSDYANIAEAITGLGLDTVTGGILADLGVSSMQLDDASRGFSFMADGPLDLRMDPTQPTTAADLVNALPEKQLADIIFRYGEERLSRRIAHKIVESRPVHSTGKLAALVAGCIPQPKKKAGPWRDTSHPATRTFQALRIAVNHELESLEKFLRNSLKLMAPGARLVVITFHSLEDRRVKQILREAASPCICPPRQPVCTCDKQRELLIITPKPLIPNASEVLANPRSRSAKLRAGEKVI